MKKPRSDKTKNHVYHKKSIIITAILGLVIFNSFIFEINLISAKDFTTSDKNNLFINELMADNDITIPGPDMNYPDWIELYNSGLDPLNISGMYLTDNLNNPTKWQFPNNTTIESGGYLLIWGDGYNSSKEGLYASFSLNANGELVALFASDGTTLIDSVTYRKQIRDTSYGRLPDAGDNWEYLSNPTPGWTNGESKSNGEIPNWVLPILIIIVILVFIAAIIIRKIIIRRDFK